jgi:hypothetical protein
VRFVLAAKYPLLMYSLFVYEDISVVRKVNAQGTVPFSSQRLAMQRLIHGAYEHVEAMSSDCHIHRYVIKFTK